MENIMKYETVLPQNFDGTFRFTNWTDHDFVGRWNGKDYIFPKQTTSPIIMPEHSPVEIQQIRKHFAKKLAEEEFFRSESFSKLNKQEKNDDGSPRLNSIHQAGTYSIDQLTPYIQKCLDPLPEGKVQVQVAPRVDTESKLTKDEDGIPNTVAVKANADLKEERKAMRRKVLGE